MTIAPKAPPGWYPDTEGNQRYWDGQDWLDIPPPEAKAVTSSAKLNTRARAILISIMLVFVLLASAGGTGAYILKTRADERDAAIAQKQEEEREEKAVAEAEAKEEQERLAANRLRKDREESIASVEMSITKMAEGHLEEEILTGSILDVACTPVQGGSAEPLLEDSTVFDCFVTTEELEGGQRSGYHYNATMNWKTDVYTYGPGAP